jgi:tRNA A37 threonylcarbamoyladenosine modification protein TsaB
MILVIQTVRPEIEVMLLDEEFNLITSRKWQSEKDELAKVLPEIEVMLSEADNKWNEIKKIVVFNGIGGFSSTRVGVTIANTLAFILKAELYEMSWLQVLEGEKASRQLFPLVREFLGKGPQSVKVAKPIYKSAPIISASKKRKFN